MESIHTKPEGEWNLSPPIHQEEEFLFNEEKIIAKWAADMYDANETDTADVDFALSIVGDAPKRILEVACGSGRILVPLAKAGHDAAGLDIDADMLDKISPKAAGLQNIRWRRPMLSGTIGVQATRSSCWQPIFCLTLSPTWITAERRHASYAKRLMRLFPAGTFTSITATPFIPRIGLTHPERR